MSLPLKQTYSGKRVLVTGNSGFKGSWLSLWLLELGAEVIGYSLEAPTDPSLFELAHLENKISHIHGDVRDPARLKQTLDTYRPHAVFHLAAQPIVLHSFERPLETFEVNAMGTAYLLEACRDRKDLEAIVVVTTDKCYDNKEWVWGYRENDPLGGHDPYSASKAMTELVASSYRHSFFSHSTPIATARAGNVLGGGDFSPFRLVPDSMKALIAKEPVSVRNPQSTRPWMHVLDPLHGYLILGKKLMEQGSSFAEAWNFGPKENKAVTAAQIVEYSIRQWGEGDWIDAGNPQAKPEMNTLKLNWDKSACRLEWSPVYTWTDSLARTVEWFKSFEQGADMSGICIDQIHAFMDSAENHQLTTEKHTHEVYTHTP